MFSMLLLLLSYFSPVWLCAIPEMAAHQAPPSLGFSRQEHWSGCHFLLQCMKVKSESEVAQLCPTPSDPMDCSPPGPSIHGIFQARVLEWVAIAFPNFNTQSRFIIAFLPRSKHLLISLSTVILESKKIKPVTVSIVSPSICHDVMGPYAMILVL